MVSHKVSKLYIIQKTHKKLMGKIPVAGKRLNLGVEGPGGSPPGGDKIEVYGGSHPGQESRSLSGVRPIPTFHKELRASRSGPSWKEYWSGGTGDHPGVDIKHRVLSSVSDWYLEDFVDLREIHNVPVKQLKNNAYFKVP